jgi:hypothetical protein
MKALLIAASLCGALSVARADNDDGHYYDSSGDKGHVYWSDDRSYDDSKKGKQDQYGQKHQKGKVVSKQHQHQFKKADPNKDKQKGKAYGHDRGKGHQEHGKGKGYGHDKHRHGSNSGRH